MNAWNFASEDPLNLKIRFEHPPDVQLLARVFENLFALKHVGMLSSLRVKVPLSSSTRELLAAVLDIAWAVTNKFGYVPLVRSLTCNLGVTQDQLISLLGWRHRGRFREHYTRLESLGICKPRETRRWEGHGHFNEGSTLVLDLAGLCNFLEPALTCALNRRPQRPARRKPAATVVVSRRLKCPASKPGVCVSDLVCGVETVQSPPPPHEPETRITPPGEGSLGLGKQTESQTEPANTEILEAFRRQKIPLPAAPGKYATRIAMLAVKRNIPTGVVLAAIKIFSREIRSSSRIEFPAGVFYARLEGKTHLGENWAQECLRTVEEAALRRANKEARQLDVEKARLEEAKKAEIHLLNVRREWETLDLARKKSILTRMKEHPLFSNFVGQWEESFLKEDSIGDDFFVWFNAFQTSNNPDSLTK